MKRLLLILLTGMPISADEPPEKLSDLLHDFETQDLDARLADIVRRLGDERPAVRERADTELREIGPALGGKLTPLCRHDDPEVASRVQRMMREEGIFADPERTRRMHEIFKELERTGKRSDDRRELVRELLNLGPESVGRVALELEACPFAIVDEPTRIVAPGAISTIPIRFRNDGSRHAWVAHGYISGVRFAGFDGACGFGGGGRFGGRFACGGRPVPVEDKVIAWLAAVCRVAPGEEMVEHADMVKDPPLGIHLASGALMKTDGGPVGTFSGAELQAPVERDEIVGTARVAVLEERPFRYLEVVAMPAKDGVHPLEVRSPAAIDASAEVWWWVAEGPDALFLESGPLALTVVEGTNFVFRGEVLSLPEGTVALWFGGGGSEGEQGAKRVAVAPSK